MSYSVAFIGTPEKVIEALKAVNLTGASKAEFDKVLPGVVTLVEANTGMVRVELSGHAYQKTETEIYSQCTCKVETLYGLLV